jgi:hypothetical protein
VACGAAGRKHERVRERRASGKIDGYDIFGFIVFEGRPDSGEKCRLELGNVVRMNGSTLSGQGQAPSDDDPPSLALKTAISLLIPIFGAAPAVLR